MCGLTKAANLYYGNHARLIYADDRTPVQKIKLWMDNCSAAFQMLLEAKGEIPSFAKEFHNLKEEGFRIVEGKIEGDLSLVRRFAQARNAAPSGMTEAGCHDFELSLYLLHLAEAHEKAVPEATKPIAPEPAQESKPEPKPVANSTVKSTAAPRKTFASSGAPSLFELAGI